MRRVVRNFWLLVAASVVAVGVLSTALRMPPSPAAGTLTALAGAAAVVSLALAGRILVVTARARAARPTSRLETNQRRRRAGSRAAP